MNVRKSWAALLTGTALAACPVAAFAQTVPAAPAEAATDETPTVEAPAEQNDDASSRDGELVVTGSRIATNGNNMPTPVTVVSATDLSISRPTTLIDGLNTLPVFSGSRGQQSNPIGSGAAGAGSPASNQLNLRNLSANRTLILFDGQRVAPTTITGVVDVDIIPQMLIQRVEVVTGGTSAVYGSDAVAGVVNFIPDRKFTGIKLQAQAGETQLGDNKNYKVGVAFGTNLFDGRVHIMASYEHYDTRGVLDRFSRDWNKKYGVVGTGSATSPYILLANLRNNTASFGGLVTNGTLAGQQFRANGLLSTFVHGTATPTGTAEVGGDGYYQSASLVAPLKFDQAYFRADADLGGSINAHFQIARDKKNNKLNYQWPSLTGLTISRDNALLPAAYRAQLVTANQTTFGFAKILSQAPELQPDVTSEQIIVNAGFDGRIGGWRWELSGNYGKTTLNNNFVNNVNNENLSAALDAVVNPLNGQIVCNSALTGQHPDCVPLNIFGPTSASQGALDYILDTTHYTAHTSTIDFNGSISGRLFDTWAGAVSTAISAEWRKTSFDSETDAMSVTPANCAGLRFNCRATTLLWANAFAPRSEVSVSVKEVAAEVEVPLLRDSAIADSLSFNGAARYTSYSTSGDYWTWKGGLDWRVNSSLRFRGTISRDIRAPTLNDLFAPAGIQATTAVDQLTGLQPTVPSYRAGNPNLVAEIGHTKTFGLVYEPSWLPRFSLTIDAFFIRVDNAIVEVKGEDSVIQQTCYASGGTSNYCTLQDRPLNYTDKSAANAVTAWRQYNINISSITTKGVDVEAAYRAEIFGKAFNFRGFLTWQPHTVYKQPGLSDVDMGGAAYGPSPLIASPSVRVTLTESVNLTDAFRVDLQQRYRNALRLTGDTGLTVACCKVAPVTYFDLNLSYRFKAIGGDSELFFNIQNLLDKDPPPSAPPGSTTPGAMGGWAIGDDPLGRSFVGGVRFKF